jgi:transposase
MEHGGPISEVQALSQRVAELESLVRQQQATITHQQALMAEQQATISAYQEQLSRAAEQIALLKKALFSPRRERYAPSADQQLLFTSQTPPTAEAADEEEVEDEEEPPPACRRRGRRPKILLPQFLPRERIEYPLPESERPCTCCGHDRVVIRQQVTNQLELDPPRAYVVEHVRFTYACPQCRRGDQVLTTSKPPQAIEKSPFGASVLAWLVTAKFTRHLPTYRQQEILLDPVKRWLSRSLLCRLLGGTAKALLPLHDWLRARVLQSYVLGADETTLRVLGLKAGEAALAYLWAYAGDVDHPYVYYDFRTSRSREGPRAVLTDYEGHLLSDGYSVYESLVAASAGRLVGVSCWAHARRGFDEARCTTDHPLLHEALAALQRVYDVEDRAADLSHGDRADLRQRESAPILARLRERLEDAYPTLRPRTKLAEAIHYTLHRWEALGRYLADGRLPIDNNLVERLLRPVAIGRKNYLFAGSPQGGRTAAILYTIVQSARRNCVDVLAYLTDVLRKLPALAPGDAAGLDALLPDHWLASHPEHRLIERERESLVARHRRRVRRAARRALAS